MAKQLQVTVVAIGTTGLLPRTMSFDTGEILINTWVSGNINAAVLFEDQLYFVTEAVADLLTAANTGGTSLIEATVIAVDRIAKLSSTMLFPANANAIGVPTGVANANAYIDFNGHRYFATETAEDLTDAANVGGGGSVTIGGTYDTNADAVAALGTGQLYKSSTLINGSPIVLITI